MEKYTYTAEEVKVIGGQILEKGVKEGSNKEMELSLCLRYGVPRSKLDCMVQCIDKLTDIQTMDICACIVIDLDLETIKRMCENPQEIEHYKKAYFDALYDPKRQVIYKEVFQEFHVQWQSNYDQLLKQTTMLSQFLDFMKEQLDKKELEIEQYRNPRKEEKNILPQSTAAKEEPQKEEAGRKKEKKEKPDTWEEENRMEKPERDPVAQGKPLLGKVKELMRQTDPEKYLIKLFARLQEDQMEEVLDGFEQGLQIGDIRRYAKKEFSARQMHEMKKLLLKKYESCGMQSK